MKLRCVLVLALVSLVTATPHGYGVKGGAGAAAKAEAAAGAGAFAGIPLAVPSGAGYSGSFAKSSSSSFAASSASSSASSFSFSGSGTVGTGANGLPDAEGNGAGAEGCTGNCKSANNAMPNTTGAGSNNQAFSGAKAAAGAGAVAISGPPYDKNGYSSPCLSGDCANQKTPDCGGSGCSVLSSAEKCTLQKCGTTPQAIDSKNKCVAGQCSPSISESLPSYDSDDIQVNVASTASKTSQSPNDQPVKYNKKPSDYGPSQSPTPNKPTTYLTTPKEDSPCTSPDCAPLSTPHADVYDNDKPSSYNVPILGPNYRPSTQYKEPCSTGNCINEQPGNPRISLPSGPSGSGSICASGSCQNYPNNQINAGLHGVPSGYKPISSSVEPTANPSSATRNPSFAQPSAPAYSAFVNTGAAAAANAIGNYGVPKPTTASTTKKLPAYTGGFGGPAGILKPNDFSVPNKVHKPVPSTAPINPAAAPCTSGNCAFRPTQPQANIPTCSTGNCGSETPVFTSGIPSVQPPSKPAVCASGSCGTPSETTPNQHNPPVLSNPTTSTGNFGGPAGILRPNDYSKPSPKPTPVQGSYNPPSFPSVQHNPPNEPSSGQYRPGKPSICASGNCPALLGSTPAQHNPPEPSNPTTPTGNFGGPAGILRPNDYSKPSPKPTPVQGSYKPPGFPPVQHNPPNEPSSGQYQPGKPSICASGNCPALLGSTPAQHNPPEPSNPTTPTGNFGGPAGILRPNDYSKPSPKPTPVLGSYNPPGFPSVQHNLPNEPSSSQYQPGKPPICASGNCPALLGSTSAQHNPLEPSNPTTPTGNFGGPAGILKPNDYSKPLVNFPNPMPAQESFSPPNFPSVHHDQTYKPSTVQYTPAGNPSICSSANCGSQAPSSPYNPSEPSNPNTSQIPSAGFGGPAGILKPNDFKKPLTPSYKPTPAATGNYNPSGLSFPKHEQFNEQNTPQYKPVGPSGPTACSSGNCAYQPLPPQVNSLATAQTYHPSSPGSQPVTSGSYYSTSPSSSKYSPSNSLSQTYSSTGAEATGSLHQSCSSGKCGPVQPSPQYDSRDTTPLSSANTYNPQPCASGNCGSSNQIPNIPSASVGEFSPATCTSGNCRVNSITGHSAPHYNQPGAPNIAVGAVASAGAVAYTGGFGGPPGLLKPYDGGKLSSSFAGLGPKGSLGAAPYGPAAQSSLYGKPINGAGSLLSGAGAQASAVAGAAAGVYGGNGNLGGYNGQESGNPSLKGGCTNGCESQGGANFGHNKGLDGFGTLSAAGVSAKSVASAIGGGGAGAYGQAGSFASSSASAHASAGAATKGGYGRR